MLLKDVLLIVRRNCAYSIDKGSLRLLVALKHSSHDLMFQYLRYNSQ